MYFENNKKINEEQNKELGRVRKENIELNDQIQKCKRKILSLV
jgi:hypothetical protein